jgi:hypothetical protein
MLRKLFLTGLLSGIFICASAQNKADSLSKAVQNEAEAIGQGGDNEIKLNLLYTVIGIPEISYERLLKDNMGVGISLFAAIDKSQDYNFALTPHFRVYFGAKKAAGFFIEGNAAVITSNSVNRYIILNGTTVYSDPSIKSTNLGLGAAAGAKFLTRNGFTGEIYLGLGRIFGNDNGGLEGYPRSGITIGKRF